MKVLGFDGTEVTAKAKYNTYCNLCHKKICKGETVITWRGHSFMVHEDCGLVEGRMSNQEFRDDAKVRKYKKKQKKTGSLRSPTTSLRSVVSMSRTMIPQFSLGQSVRAYERSEYAGALCALSTSREAAQNAHQASGREFNITVNWNQPTEEGESIGE